MRGFLHFVVGLALRRFRAAALSFAVVLIAFPFGYGDAGNDTPIWLSMLVLAPIGASIAAAAVVAARLAPLIFPAR